MVVGGSRQETLDPGFALLGTRQQGVPVILREQLAFVNRTVILKEPILPERFEVELLSITVGYRSGMNYSDCSQHSVKLSWDPHGG
ncbi:unnamed protein product [Schistosoma margrebowiei]|uniref:Uncharacterized protein n=1 Tax=Schistosoma margrebowiei TaxID=48269 RepID=A0A183MNV0_9TREM|nr:unnamed protein product [Schistosoma margrebowiei]